MSPELGVAIVGTFVAFLGVIMLLIRRLPRRVKQTTYTRKWRGIQILCADKSSWPAAILLSDDTLDDVLKKRKVTGKTMGERMVNAQERFSNNDSLWNAHKLANHLRNNKDGVPKLKEHDVKKTLMAFRQAMRDLKAL
jgi:hypothetical protein